MKLNNNPPVTRLLRWNFCTRLDRNHRGIFTILGFLIVNSSVQSVQWGLVGTWLWIILFLILGSIGILMLQHARNLRTTLKS